ncbi:MAG: carboxypeptidase regulatory-like domain-containing protein [Dehalococcoidia bacterium]
MKKALYLILALVLALGLVIPLAGCGVLGIGGQTAMTTAGTGRIDVDNIPDGGVTGGTDHGFCDPEKPYEWHFVINKLDPEEAAPAYMTAVFAVEGEVNIPLEKVTPGGVAHYTLEQYLDATLVGAYAYLEQQVTYNRFNLSHAPCGGGPGPVIQYTITASAGSGGSISPEGAVGVSHGGSQTFNITPSTGYKISDVLVDGASAGAVASYTFTDVTANHTIQATFSLIQYTITASAGSGGSISPVGAVGVSHGESKGFSITPNVGYAIGGVLVDGTSVGAVSSYTFTDVMANHSIHAAFNMIQHTITASAGVGGNISPVGAVVVSHGQSQSFSITANAGYAISDVLVDGNSVGAVSSYSFPNVTGNHTIEAVFSVIQYTITASAGGGGSMSPVGAVGVSHGQSQGFSITPNTGYAIGGVLVDGTQVGAVSSYTFTNVTGNHSIHAAFNMIQHTITASAGVGGNISPVGAVVVSHGQSQPFNITPNAGYAISDVLVNGISVGAVSSYTFTNVTEDHTIHADFSLNQYTITASAGGGGSISPVGAAVVSHGQSQGFNITPNAGYKVKDVVVDGASVGEVSSYTFAGVASDHTIHANFELIQNDEPCYRLTLAVSPGGGGTATDETGAACYEEGNIVAIRALATECYDFVSWTAPAGVFADAYAAETGFTMPGRAVTVTANFAFIGNPTRALPDQVLPGEKFEVTVTFAAPYDGFHAIALTDVAPGGWDVSVNVLWADPEATAVHTPAAETAAYVWYGPYDVCVPFTTVYEVRVPVNAEPGTYTFSGSLKYYIEPHPAPPYEQEVSGDIQVRVKEGETVRIAGVTREVDGAILPGAAVVLYQNGEAIGNVVSDESGDYEFEFSELGDYEVVTSKAGFRGEAQSISVATLAIYTLDFVGDHGLIPDAPSISYVLACMSLWKFGEPPLQLSTVRVLDVVSAWIYPMT